MRPCLALLCLFALAAGEDAPPYVTSWLGNSFGAGDQSRYVQGHIQDMAVSPEGRVYATTWWDEDCREQSAYQDGQPVLWFPPFGHSGGRAVAATARYVFFAYGGFSRAKKDALIRRFDRTAPLQTRRDARNPATHYRQTGEWHIGTNDVRGLAVLGDELFAAIEKEDVIVVFDQESMRERRRLPFTAPGKLVATTAGTLWVIRHMERFGGKPPVLVELRPDGSETGRSIDAVVNPRALAVHPDGRLLVGENGPRNQVLIFDVAGTAAPREVGTFGESLLAAPAGATKPTRFDGLTGIGVDAQGRWYLASDGNLRGQAASDGSGTVLRALTPQGGLVWELLGLEFLENVGIDPQDDAREVYTLFHRYRMDYAKPAGQEWTRIGYTLDRFRYPQDVRLTGKHRYAFGFARIQGRPFLYVTSQWPGNVDVYRFDGNTAVPAVRFTGLHGKDDIFPEGGLKPEGTEDRFGSIWRDLNGDGQMDPQEFTAGARMWHWGRSVDPATGDIWSTAGSGVLHLRCEGIDGNGVPIYSHAATRWHRRPAPFTDLRRGVYDPATDSMYLTGSTTELPRVKQFADDRSTGRALGRFDAWSTGSPVLRWVKPLVQSDGGPVEAGTQHREAGKAEMPQGLSHAGDYVFVGAVNPPHIYALAKEDGRHVETFRPGPEVGGIAGWLDIPMPFNAWRRADGEYLLFVEEGARHKVLMYRWRPPPAQARGR